MGKSVARPGEQCPRCGEVHEKCLGHNRRGRPCGRVPSAHGKVCHIHGGASPLAKKGEQDRAAAAAARDAAAAFGLPRDVDPATALLEEVGRSAGAVEWLRVRVVEAGADPDNLVFGVRSVKHKTVQGKQVDDESPAAAVSETTREVGPGVHLWVQLYQQERRHLADVCAKALAAGVEERRVRVAERLGTQLADVIRAVLADLQLTPAQRALVPQVVPRHLRAVASP